MWSYFDNVWTPLAPQRDHSHLPHHNLIFIVLVKWDACRCHMYLCARNRWWQAGSNRSLAQLHYAMPSHGPRCHISVCTSIPYTDTPYKYVWQRGFEMPIRFIHIFYHWSHNYRLFYFCSGAKLVFDYLFISPFNETLNCHETAPLITKNCGSPPRNFVASFAIRCDSHHWSAIKLLAGSSRHPFLWLDV